MAVNDLTFNQLATVLNSIVSQATGKTTITPTNVGEFISVGQTGLKAGYDPLMTAISQVLTRTMFASRPYSRKFADLNVTAEQFGNATRKLSISDKQWEQDNRFTLTDGQSVDQYVVKKPSVLQENFYGSNVFGDHVTVYTDQLDCAFTNPADFAQFLGMVTQNMQDRIEQAHENLARSCLVNFMAGKLDGDTSNVIHLITEYNDVKNPTVPLTSANYKQNEYYTDFMKWVYARVKTVSDHMTERSEKFHINVTADAADGGKNKTVMRHTPLSKQKMYVNAEEMNEIESTVLSSVFNDRFMKFGAYERVNYWQALDTPEGISVKPTYLTPTGVLKTPTSDVVESHIFAVLFDADALGYTTINERVLNTPINANGGFYNIFYKFTDRYWNSFTENGVVFVMD